MTTNDEGGKPAAISRREAVILVGTLASIYVVSQFLRNSIGVIAPNLASELQLSAGEIGVLSSAFFFAFASAQIPLGVALDRYGPKNCMLVCAIIATAGAVLFALGNNPVLLVIARILMGLGSSCYLMAPLALYARRFDAHRFATLVGIQMGVGTLGTLAATAPFAWAVAAIGWQQTFLAVGGVMVLAGLLVAVIIKDDGQQGGAPRESLRESLAGTLEALRAPSVGRLFLMHLTAYSSFVIVVGLWGGPYLTHIYGYSLIERGDMLFLAVVAQIVGAILWGTTDRLFNSYKIPVLTGALLTAAAMAYVAIFGTLSPLGLVLWIVAVGVFTAYTPVLIAHGKTLFPPHLVGRGMTLLNMGTMGGVFIFQTLSGFVIDMFPVNDGVYSLAAYRAVFALQALCVVAGCVGYLRARDPRRTLHEV